MSRLAMVLALVFVFVSGVASAQAPGPGAPMPVAVDLAKVPIGLWAEYSMSMASMPPMKMRLALVAKNAGGQTLEMTAEGGMMAQVGGKMVVQTRLEPDPKAGTMQTKKVVMQLGDNDPMEMPAEAAQQSRFTKPDPKALVGEETVEVPAGKYKAKHYREASAGATVDYWISDKALPLGLVKMVGDSKGVGAQGPVKVELAALGKGAKQVITKAPVPFDPAKLGAQASGAKKK
jgi:hypothetical protein